MQRKITAQSGLETTDLILNRFPKGQKELIAHDSADSHVVHYLAEHYPNVDNLLILNDRFGAITVSTEPKHRFYYGDSFCAIEATRQNLVSNHGAATFIQEADTGDLIPNLVIVRLPKSLTFFESQLAWIASKLPKGTPVIVTAMIKHLPHRAKELMERYLGTTHLSHAWKKSRLLLSKLELTHPPRYDKQTSFSFKGRRYQTLPNVFCNNKLDPGAALMLETYKQLDSAETVADLGCGSGILGIEYAREFGSQVVHFFDDSWQAIQSAQVNSRSHLATGDTEFYWGHAMKQARMNQCYDLILNNPPFHQDQVIGDFIATAMFQDASKRLTENGQLIVVGNRHLGYHRILRRWFKRVNLINANAKFVVISASKI